MTLIDFIDLLFSNLEELTDISFIDEVLEHIRYSSISYLEPVFAEIKKFYKDNSRFPDFPYLKVLGGDLIRQNDSLEFSSDIFIKIINMLKEEARFAKAIEALSKRDSDKALNILQIQSATKVKPITGMEDMGEVYKQMKSRPPGLKTAIPEVDRVFRAFSRASTTTIVAPPKNGKTTVGVSIFYNNVMNGLNCIYIILEGTSEEIKFNLLSLHSKKMGKPITAFAMKSMEMTAEEETIYEEVRLDFEKTKTGNYAILEVQHFAAITPSEVTRTLVNLKKAWNDQLDGVFSDYIQLYKHYRVPGITEEKSVINFWVRYWHDISISLNFAKVLLAQMNREGEQVMISKNIVTAKALAEANELERSSARVFAVQSNPFMQQNNTIRIYFVYHRYGPVPAEYTEVYADFGHFQVGENSFSTIRTLANVENNLNLLDQAF